MDHPTANTMDFLTELIRTCAGHHFPTQVGEILRLTGERLEADRCTAMLFDGGKDPITTVYEWVKSGLQDRTKHWSKAGFHELPWVMEQLRAGQVVHVPRIEDLPQSAQSERAHWLALSIHSIALAPIFAGPNLRLVLVIQTEQHWKTWEPENLQTLQLCGQMLQQIFTHEQDQARREAEVTRLKGIIDQLQASLAEENKKRLTAESGHQQAAEMVAVLPNGIPGLVLLIDTEGWILGANEELSQSLGKPLKDIIGAKMSDVLPEAIMRTRWAHIQQTIESGVPAWFNDERDGRHFSNHLYPVRDQSGAVSRVGIFITDVSQQKQTEARLREIQAQHDLELQAARLAHTSVESNRLQAMRRLRGKLIARLSCLYQTNLSPEQLEIVQDVEAYLDQAGVLVEVPSPGGSRRPQKRPLILLVEDNQIIADNFRSFMEAKGHRVKVALNGQSALEIVDKDWPDIVFMDINLPDMDGLDVIAKLRAMLEFSHTPIIALTAHSNSERERCLQAGASDFLAKPVSLKVLLETAERWLRNPDGEST